MECPPRNFGINSCVRTVGECLYSVGTDLRRRRHHGSEGSGWPAVGHNRTVATVGLPASWLAHDREMRCYCAGEPHARAGRPFTAGPQRQATPATPRLVSASALKAERVASTLILLSGRRKALLSLTARRLSSSLPNAVTTDELNDVESQKFPAKLITPDGTGGSKRPNSFGSTLRLHDGQFPSIAARIGGCTCPCAVRC